MPAIVLAPMGDRLAQGRRTQIRQVASSGNLKTTPLKFSTLLLKWVALILFTIWLGWHASWIAKGSTPPSLFYHLTGIPVPSTGMTRSINALLEGDVRQSLFWNPFTLPLLALFSLSAIYWIRRLRGERDVSLPRWVVICWVLTLLAAWLAKFIIGPASW